MNRPFWHLRYEGVEVVLRVVFVVAYDSYGVEGLSFLCWGNFRAFHICLTKL